MKHKLLLAATLFLSVATTASASDPYRRHRYNHFKGLATNTESIVFVGNSITDMGNWPEVFGNNANVVSRGVSGGYSWEVRDNVYNWIVGHPKKVFIKIGTNDLNVTQGSPEGIAENIDKTLAICLAESPDTKVYIQSIIPCSNGNRSDEKIRRSNELLQAVCEKYSNAEFFNLYQYMGGVATGWPLGCVDKLHLTGAGYATWAHAIEENVGLTTVYPEKDEAISIQKNYNRTDVHGGRIANFSIEPTRNGDIIFIGDGLVQSGEWHELLHGSAVVKNHGTGWEVNQGDMTMARDIIDATLAPNSTITRELPKAIVLYTGSTGTFNADTYESLVTKIHSYNSAIQVYCLSLQPKAATYSVANNQAIEGICDKYDFTSYIDVATELSAHLSDADYYTENHPYFMSYVTIAQEIARQAPELGLTAMTTAEAQRNYAVANAAELVYTAKIGDGIGEYPAEGIEAVRTALANLHNATGDEAISAATTNLNNAISELNARYNVSPEHGKVYTVYNDHSGTPYYLNDQLASSCTALTATAANDKSQQWIVWGDETNGYEFVNVKTPNRKLTAHSGVTTFDITNKHVKVGNSLKKHGTDEHKAGNSGILSLSGGKFTGAEARYNEFTNANGNYSTDFVFLPTGENAYKVQGGNVTVAGQNYTNGSWVISATELTPGNVTVEAGKTANISNNVITVSDAVVYTIANYVKTPETTRYLKNENGSLKLVEATTLDASDSKFQWTLRANGTNYDIVSVADGKVLDYAKGLSETGTPFAKSEGTTSDYSALYNSTMGGGRYLAASADGTHFGTTSGNYYAKDKTQYNGWSTDFIFTEVPTTLEGTAVSLSFKNGSFGGSGTYCSSWTSSGTPAVKVEAYNKTNLVNNLPCAQASADAFIVYTGNRNAAGTSNVTPYISYLRVSAPTGYYVTGYSFDVASHDLTATGSVTITTPKGSSYTVTSTSAAQSEKYTFADTEHTYFDLNLTGENKGVKFTNFIVYVKEVPDEPAIEPYTISSTTGSLYNKDNGTTGNYFATWKSTQAPQLLFGCGVNNMRYSSTNLELMTGTSSKSTYTLTAPAGYVITGYTFNYANNNHDTALTLTHNGAVTQSARAAKNINVEDVELSSASFTLEGDNGKGLVLTDFVVTIEPFVVKPPVLSTEDDVKWYYIVNACSKTYCHDKVMYYDPDDDRMKFANKTFDARYIWSFWRGDNGKLAIKNYKGEYLGTAGSGTGGGTAFGKSDTLNYIYSIDEAYGYLTINDGGVPLHAQESGSIIVRWGASADGASLWRFEKADVSHADAAISTTLVQQGKVSTGRGNKHVPIIRSTMKVSGLEGDVTFSGVKGKVTGTNLADITKVQAYFATDNRELHVADDRMEWRNSNAQLYGTAVAIDADGQFVITGANKTLAPGSYYLWITLDIADAAVEGNTVDAQILSYTVDGSDVAEENGNPQYEAVIFLSEGTVLMAGDGKFKSKYFRIPAITTTADGKRLVTLTDDRLNHNGDLPSHVYITAQYSDDNGQTWSEPKIVAGEAATGGDYAHGDAQIITNRVNGDIVGIMTCATNGQGFWGSTPERPQTWKTIISHDGGETWSVPVDHTTELYAAGSPNPGWQGGFSGSGAGLQKRDGTLVSPFVNRDENGNRQFALFESVDAGQTWHVAGKPCMIGAADEPKVLERNNGDLAISVRATGRNFHNVTSDNGETWNLPVDTRFTTGISGNACDGEYMVWCSTLDGNERNIAFQTVPNNNNRRNVSIALSVDEGDTFEDPKTICPRGSAYSAATVLADGTLGVYYEEEGVNDGYTMRFVRFSLDWASDHKYAFTAENPYKRYTSLQAIVNAILRNVYQGVSVGNATNEIKRMNEATAE